MNKLLKYSLWSVGGLIVLLLVAVAIITATFNPNDYKPLIVQMIKDKKQRTLNIEGNIKLAFWPKLGADLGKVSLSEHNGDKEFAAMDSAKIFVAVMPLLSKQLVVDTVRVDGVRANIVRFKDGTTNFDDLLSKEESEEIKFDIDGVLVSNASVNLTDEIGNRHFKLDGVTLKTGHIAKGQPIDLDTQFHVTADNPKMDAKIQLKGNLLSDPEQKRFVARGLDAALQGSLDSFSGLDAKLAGDLEARPETTEFLLENLKLAVKGNMQGQALDIALEAPRLAALKGEVSGKEARLSFTRTQGGDTLSAKMVIADMKGSSRAFQSSGISGEISGKQGARSLAGKFSAPFNGNLETLVFDLPKLAGNVDIKDPALPNGAAKIGFNLNVHVDAKQEQVALGMNANIDGANIKGDVALAGFKQSRVKFDLSADQLDLNKLLGKQEKPVKAEPATTKPADLSALKTVLAQGSVNIGTLLYDKYRVSNLAATIKADGQALTVSPFSAKLDDSQIKGSVGITHFDKPLYTFDLDIDRIDADRYVAAGAPKAAETGPAKPLDLSALKALNANGSLRIGSLKYGKIQSSNIRIDLKADGDKLDLNPFSAKIDDSQVKAVLGITRFQDPRYSFDIDIDKLDADRYLTKNEAKSSATKPAGDTPLDLSALKTLNASGEARLGWLKIANVKTSNVRLGVKAEGGLVALAPFSADLYQGNMAGALNVDARATPSITFKDEMKNVAIGPLLVDAINNDMLEGKGTVSVDVKTQGVTVGALKKALNGNAALALADGAVKGIDIAGTIRDIKGKLNVLKSQSSLSADQKKRTEFSEMTASFKITNGVAHNDDLSMKSPLLRVAGSGDIDIGNEKLNYIAKPTVVATLKGQGGADIGALNGLTFPVKITGTFADPKYGVDYAAIGTAIAQKNLLGNVGGEKGEAVQKLLGGDQAGALEGLLGGSKNKAADQPTAPSASPQTAAPTAPSADQQTAQPTPEPKKPLTPEEKARKKLNKLLGF